MCYGWLLGFKTDECHSGTVEQFEILRNIAQYLNCPLSGNMAKIRRKISVSNMVMLYTVWKLMISAIRKMINYTTQRLFKGNINQKSRWHHLKFIDIYWTWYKFNGIIATNYKNNFNWKKIDKESSITFSMKYK